MGWARGSRGKMPSAIATAAVACILGTGALAFADDTSARAIARARAAYEALDFDAVLMATADVAPDAPIASRVEALLLAALAHQALVDPAAPTTAESLAHDRDVDAALAEVLALDARYVPPRTYPAELRARFELARARDEGRRAQRALAKCDGKAPPLSLSIPDRARGGRALPLRWIVDDPRRCVRTLRVTWGLGGLTGIAQTDVALPVHGGVATLVIPGDVTASRVGVTLALAAEAFDAEDGRLSVLGSLAAPERVVVAPGMPATPLYRRWWFWAGVGALVVGAAVAVEQLRSVGPQRVRF
jgi:hypothetical protein